RMLLTSVPTVQARITRAKRTLSAARVPFETPDPAEWSQRLAGVLGVVYLIFTEGYAATVGEQLVRPDLAREALRLGRVLAALVPTEPEASALVALIELQSARFPARTDATGAAVLLEDQHRRRWGHGHIRRGQAALAHADRFGKGRGRYALQAAIAQCHVVAPSVAATDWEQVVVLYEALSRLAPNPVVELNLAVAVAMAGRPEEALDLVEAVAAAGALRGSHLVPSVRGELLGRLGRRKEAGAELLAAAQAATDAQVARTLRVKAAELGAECAAHRRSRWRDQPAVGTSGTSAPSNAGSVWDRTTWYRASAGSGSVRRSWTQSPLTSTSPGPSTSLQGRCARGSRPESSESLTVSASA